ncbi:hypothetical protein EJ03DRAFT_211599 [Teratosphaeria nubilosa]|uniref:Uncharacterized protein n=1 Tax=Teratosphaeria nubilosa TaxID=161662 RepID=A0A6G1LGM0_9PEZI|nr:hypothetical protein EJ03DRAFT_211599 [Teratosphaeria nubilosa]
MAFFGNLVKDVAGLVKSKREESRIAALPDVTDDAVVKPSCPKSSRHTKSSRHNKSTSQNVDSPAIAVTKAKKRLAELQAVDIADRSANAIKRHKAKLSQARKAIATAQAALYEVVAEKGHQEEDHLDAMEDGAAPSEQEDDEKGEEHQSSPAPEPAWLLAVSLPRPAKKQEQADAESVEEHKGAPVTSQAMLVSDVKRSAESSGEEDAAGSNSPAPSNHSSPAPGNHSSPAPSSPTDITSPAPDAAEIYDFSEHAADVVDDSSPFSGATQIITSTQVGENDHSGILDIEDEPLTHAELKDYTLNALQCMQRISPLWPETKKLLWHILGQDKFYRLSGTDYTFRQMFAMLGRDVLGVVTEDNEVALREQDGDIKSKSFGGQ